MGNYQGYQKYKDSGVVWLGDIPEHWEVKRLKFICTKVQTGTTPPTTQGEYYTEGNLNWFAPSDFKDGQILLKESIKKLNIQALEDRIVKHIPKGSVLIVGIGATLGKVGLLEIDAASNQQINAIFLNKNNNSKFIAYHLFISQEIMKVISNSTTLGILNQEKTKLIPLTFPPLNEQEKIAQFLDYKTKQIDELIKKKETLIEKLDEKRTAIISHAVTKGLDSSVPMKDSGIEWLGDIPKHWKRGVKLLQLAEEKQHSFVNGPFGSDLLTSELKDEGIPVIYSGDVKPHKFFRKSDKYVTEEKASQLNFCRVDSGDLLLAKVGDPPGDAAIYPYSIESGIVTQDVVRIKIDRRKAIPEYISLLINSQAGRFIIKLISVEATRSRFSLGDFKGIRFFIAPLQEQAEISQYGEKILLEIGKQQETISKAIELLKEYRTSLITNAVTGKIDVRQVDIP
jgi:type I restriction enzyme S subunit